MAKHLFLVKIAIDWGIAQILNWKTIRDNLT
jgi:hypothetical protein